MATGIKERVSFLEDTLNRFILHTDKTLYELSKEMKEFKDEMRVSRKEMNKRWGDLSNKLGSFAEDIAAPNVPRIAKEYFKEKSIRRYMTNIRAINPLKPEQIYEFDAIVLAENKVFLLETKFTVRMKYIESLPEIIRRFQTCFPEYADKEQITIFGSMSIPDNIVKRLTKMGVYAMAMGDETMDLLNFDEIENVQ